MGRAKMLFSLSRSWGNFLHHPLHQSESFNFTTLTPPQPLISAYSAHDLNFWARKLLCLLEDFRHHDQLILSPAFQFDASTTAVLPGGQLGKNFLSWEG